jgi:hypothetical protein
VRVYVEQREVVILDLNYGVLWLDLIGGIDDGADHCAGPLKFLRLVDDVGEARQDELLAAISRVDNLSEHPHDGLGGDDLAGLHHGQEFDADGCIALDFVAKLGFQIVASLGNFVQLIDYIIVFLSHLVQGVLGLLVLDRKRAEL